MADVRALFVKIRRCVVTLSRPFVWMVLCLSCVRRLVWSSVQIVYSLSSGIGVPVGERVIAVKLFIL